MLKGNLSRFCLVLLLLSALFSFKKDTPEVEFLDLGFKQAFKLSKTQDKLLFIYIGTERCDICQRTKPSFHDAQVVEFFNAHFVSIMMDPDNVMNNLRIGNWGISQTPSFVFMNRKKTIVYKTSGFQSPAGLLTMGGNAIKFNEKLLKPSSK